MASGHTDRDHARLSPSSAKRWLMCPGSVPLSEGIPDRTTDYAAEGTAAHELAERCLRNRLDPESFIGGMSNGFEVTDEMAAAVRVYVDWVQSQVEPGDEFEIECQLDLRHVGDDMFGTGDALIFKPESRHLIIGDYKHGKGVLVSPRENAQGLTYACGAIARYHNRQIAKVSIAIIQPRGAWSVPHNWLMLPDGWFESIDRSERAHPSGIRVWETDPIDVLDFEHDLREGAKRVALAVEKQHAAMPTPWDRTFLKAGEWCRFCKALPICPAARQRSLDAAKLEFLTENAVTTLSREQLGEILTEAEFIKARLKAVEEYAHQAALDGNGPIGWKLVAKRAMRKWIDPAEAAAAIRFLHGLPDDVLYTEPELKSPAQIEKLIPASERNSLDALYSKESSGLVLVPESDKRPAAKTDAATEFGAE